MYGLSAAIPLRRPLRQPRPIDLWQRIEGVETIELDAAYPEPIPGTPDEWRPDQVEPGPSQLGGFVQVCRAAIRAYVFQLLAYRIQIIRGPIGPVLYFLTMLLTYRAAGRTTAAGYGVAGFLLVGAFGMMLWSSSLWGGGYAIEAERSGGTLPSLFLSPANRAAVVLGYALGSLVFFEAPLIIVLGAVAVATGAHFDIASPIAALLAAAGLSLACLSLGYALSGLFVMTHRANLLANFLQSPIYLLTGMIVPISALPGPLQLFAKVFPISFGMDAMRGAVLGGSGFNDISGLLLRLLVSALVLVVLGTLFLGRVEYVAKRGADLDYF